MSCAPTCRFCRTPLDIPLVDLGTQPLANSYLPAADAPEKAFPLKVSVCPACFLAQVEDDVPAEDIFTPEYAYFSSVSTSWVEHARRYAEAMTARFALGARSKVVEVASNDGYLLQHFVTAGIPVLGVDPAAECAEAARGNGVETEVAFFNEATARRLRDAGHAADLMAANNVLAHVPDIRAFVKGFAVLLKDEGVVTFEFPHLLRLLGEVQFDTIYHEHYSYLSLLAVERVFGACGLRVFDVEELPTHGGSLRVLACRQGASQADGKGLAKVRADETAAGLGSADAYADFEPRVRAVRDSLLGFLSQARAEGKRIAAYGAAAKGNTLLNYCGVTAADIDFVVDRSPHKQGHWLPGSRIPVFGPDKLAKEHPDYVLILPWNLRDEIVRQNAEVSTWGGRFVVPVPQTTVVE